MVKNSECIPPGSQRDLSFICPPLHSAPYVYLRLELNKGNLSYFNTLYFLTYCTLGIVLFAVVAVAVEETMCSGAPAILTRRSIPVLVPLLAALVLGVAISIFVCSIVSRIC